MTYHGGAWGVVADAINARMRELNISQGELARRAGVSRPTVKGLMDGNPRGEPSPVKKRAVSLALGWEHDGIDCLLEGKPPTLLRDDTPRVIPLKSRRLEDVAREVDELRRRLEEYEQEAEAAGLRLLALVEANTRRIAALGDALRRPGDDGVSGAGGD